MKLTLLLAPRCTPSGTSKPSKIVPRRTRSKAHLALSKLGLHLLPKEHACTEVCTQLIRRHRQLWGVARRRRPSIRAPTRRGPRACRRTVRAMMHRTTGHERVRRGALGVCRDGRAQVSWDRAPDESKSESRHIRRGVQTRSTSGGGDSGCRGRCRRRCRDGATGSSSPGTRPGRSDRAFALLSAPSVRCRWLRRGTSFVSSSTTAWATVRCRGSLLGGALGTTFALALVADSFGEVEFPVVALAGLGDGSGFLAEDFVQGEQVADGVLWVHESQNMQK